jgi:hypothetical protein
MQNFIFKNRKTEEYFLSQCVGWVKEIFDFVNDLKVNQYLNDHSNKGLTIHLIRDDSYYSIYKFELKIGFVDTKSWRDNYDNDQINLIQKVITDFESTIKKLTRICRGCGSTKTEGNHILNNIGDNSKDIFFYEVTVDFRPIELCETCNFLVNREEYNIHLYNLSLINNSELISKGFKFVFPIIDNQRLSIIGSPEKVRIIDLNHIFFEFLSEGAFIFHQKNLLYKRDKTRFSIDDTINMIGFKNFKKGLYAGQNTGFKDICTKEIFTGDVIRFKWNNIESCGVVTYLLNRKEFHVVGNWWSSSLSELSEIEIKGNIFFDLERNSSIDIYSRSKNIGQEGFRDSPNLCDIDKVSQYLSFKVTPSFKKRKWWG